MAFTFGLFITIALIGIICALLGRMLGDVGNYRLNFKGVFGAFMLGLAYGVLSGSCTFGFIAPILAIITVQQKVATGILFILLFAVGHCLPIVVAGSSTAAVRKLMENSAWQGAGSWFRKGAGALIGLLGIYFAISPFVSTVNILQ